MITKAGRVYRPAPANAIAALVICQIMDDGTLDGTWTIAGQSGGGTEILTRQEQRTH